MRVMAEGQIVAPPSIACCIPFWSTEAARVFNGRREIASPVRWQAAGTILKFKRRRRFAAIRSTVNRFADDAVEQIRNTYQ